MNFIIFMPDEMQAAGAGCFGHPLAPTPNLDRLAAEGTRFELCYAQHPVCSPSRCSMLTGWYPHVAGHRTLWHLLGPHEPNLLRYLKSAGYDVYWYGKNDAFAAGTFAGSVTEAARFHGPSRGERLATDPDHPHYDSFLYAPFAGGPWETADGRCVRRAIELLRSRRRRDGPFVLYLPLTAPHPPYSAPQPWHDMYRPGDVPPLREPDLPGKPSYHRLIRRTRRLDSLDDGEFRRIAAVYLGMIGCVDHLFGELLAALDESGLADETCVIFTSDHGDWAGEYGLVEKWSSDLSDPIARVPLVIRIPGGAAGHAVATPVDLFDVFATVMDLAGARARHTHFARSLLGQLQGAPGDADRAAFAEGGYNANEPHCFEGRPDGPDAGFAPGHIYYQKVRLQQTHPTSVCRSTMVRTATHKLIHRTDDVCELYDMVADPGERDNLYGRAEADDLRGDLEKRLLDFHSRTSDATPPDEDPRGLPEGGFRERPSGGAS